MHDNLIRPGDNPDISKERKNATFSVHNMAAFIHEGEQVLKRRREILEYVDSQRVFDDHIPPEFMTREELVDRSARKAVAMTDHADAIDGSDFFGEGLLFQGLIFGRELHSMSLHYGMFLPTIQGQSDDEQMDQWLGPTIARAILGTFAQTELGHGSNLSKLETIATYDPKTEEFVIHTPTFTAAKWWPGGLGKSANHAVVMAQLWTQGVNRGPHPFFVPLRDPNTHVPFKGVKLGDIGPKFGINSNDNGFLIFDHYRIPRRNMFMRNSKVLPSGEFVAPSHAKLAFGTMVFVRSIMIKDQANQLAAASVIATRYAAVRRQGEINKDKGEVQIMDYRTQQYRIFPQLARSFAFLFAAYEIKKLYFQVTEQLNSGTTELLPQLHALSSGLKSVVSWETAQGIEQCRLACGGHGYSKASAFPDIYTYAVGGCTYEGENIVMLLQVARFLVKCCEEVRNGKSQLAEIAAYMGRTDGGRAKMREWDRVTDEEIVHDYEAVARRLSFAAYDALNEKKKRMGHEDAWNNCSILLCRASRMHVKLYLVKNFFARVRTCEDPECRSIMGDLAKLYALDVMSGALAHFMRDGFLNDSQCSQVQEGIENLLARIRPNAVAIADSWDMSDRELHSVLGRRDGNVYPELLKWAQQSTLNRQDVLPTFQKYFDPMFKEGRSML